MGWHRAATYRLHVHSSCCLVLRDVAPLRALGDHDQHAKKLPSSAGVQVLWRELFTRGGFTRAAGFEDSSRCSTASPGAAR